jgi:hypothetical protein
MPLLPELRKLRQEDSNLRPASYIARPCLKNKQKTRKKTKNTKVY